MRPLLGLSLGLLLGLGACDDDPAPPANACEQWVQCYAECRDAQYARGDDQALTQDQRHEQCAMECMEHVDEGFPTGLDLAMKAPEDVAYFWERLSFCLAGGDA